MELERLEVGVTAGILGFISGLFGMLVKHFLPSKTKATIEPQPFEVRLAKDYVSRVEFEGVQKTNLEQFGKLYDLIRAQQSEFSNIRAGFAGQLGNIEGTLKVISNQLETANKRKGD